MANSTALQLVNRILENAGELPIADAATFNAETDLTKIQLQAKRYADKVQRRLGRTSRLRTQKRKATLSLTNSTNTYSLPSNVYLEDLVEESLVITSGTAVRPPITYIDYEDWIRRYPTGESVKGVPIHFFCYPGDGTGVEKLGFSAPPNANYTVQYEYIVVPAPIAAATDEIFLSPRYEDVLWDYGQMWLEVAKSEGKAGDYAALIDRLIEEMKQYNFGSLEKPPGVDLGFKLCGTLHKGGYIGLRANSPEL